MIFNADDKTKWVLITYLYTLKKFDILTQQQASYIQKANGRMAYQLNVFNQPTW